MAKVLLPLLLILLLTGACRGASADWQPASATLPQSEAHALPRLLVQPTADDGSLLLVELHTGRQTRQTLRRAASLGAVLSADYQLVGNMLVGQDEQFFALSTGALAPTGLWLAVAQEGLRLLRADGVEMPLSASGRSPAWSPDGQWLAYQDDAGLWAVTVNEAETAPAPLTPQKLSDTSYEPLAWSADNQQLLLRRGSAVTIFDVAARRATNVGAVDGAQLHGRPAWSPDGQTIYARYGQNGVLEVTAISQSQPDNIQARLVAITVDGRNTVRDLLPNQRNQGVSDFLLSPDGALLVARHFTCTTSFGGIIPFIPHRDCAPSLLLVETATGNYQTIPDGPLAGAMAWERPLPPITLADLPLPVAAAPVTAATGHPFWWTTAEPGHNPATALALGQAGERLGTFTSVVAVTEGDEALALAVNANPPLLPPSPGYTYIAVRQRVTREVGRSAHFGSTGNLLLDDRLAAHGEIAWLSGDGQFLRELPYSADAPTEYWQLFLLETEARPWLLFMGSQADNLPDLYLRLDDEAWRSPPALVTPLSPNNIGVAEAAAVGETAVSAEWQLALLAPEAALRPSAAPELALLQIGYTGGPPRENRLLTCLEPRSFQSAAGGRVVQSDIYKTLPFANFARTVCLLPGGQFRGWLAVLPEYGEETSVFRFNPPRPIPLGERLLAFSAVAGE